MKTFKKGMKVQVMSNHNNIWARAPMIVLRDSNENYNGCTTVKHPQFGIGAFQIRHLFAAPTKKRKKIT